MFYDVGVSRHVYTLGREAEERKRMTEEQISLHHLDREREMIIRYTCIQNTHTHTNTHMHTAGSINFPSHLISCSSFILSLSLFSLVPSLHLVFSPFDVVFLYHPHSLSLSLSLFPRLSLSLSKMRCGALMLRGLIRMSLKYRALIM